MTRLLLLLLVVLVAACDTRAEPTPAAASPVLDPERLSREHESCGTTAHCAAGLRCLDQTCRREERSLVGDYYAALGGHALAAGDREAALTAYGEALRHYDIAKIAAPVELECGYGGALAAAREDKERAELAARVLHRCVAAAPPGSALRQAALRQAALLDDVGLDPAHLGREQPADVYLSREAAKPSTDALTIQVKATPEPSAKGWASVVQAIQAARDPLVACWDAAFKATRATMLSVGVPMKSSYRDSGYDDEPSYYVTQVDPKAPAPANDAERCVRDAVGAAVKGVKNGGDWSATVQVAIQ